MYFYGIPVVVSEHVEKSAIYLVPNKPVWQRSGETIEEAIRREIGDGNVVVIRGLGCDE